MIDLMCEDYKRAAENRKRVKEKYGEAYYVWLDYFLRSWPKNKPLPEGYLGYIPSVGKHEARELYGYHEVK